MISVAEGEWEQGRHSSLCSTSFFSLSLLRTAENYNELQASIKHTHYEQKPTVQSLLNALIWLKFCMLSSS